MYANVRAARERKNHVRDTADLGSLAFSSSKPIRNTIQSPRHSWQHYGISKERYGQLTEYIRSGRYASLASQAAHTANETIAEYILLSVTQNKSYDALRVKWELKEMERIPYCRTDFYGIRRYFFSIFNEKMKEIGK